MSRSFRKTHALLAVVMVMAVGLQALAQSTWDAGGGTDTNWSTPANWSGDTVPAAGANVTFGTAGSAAIVDTTSRTVGNVTLNRTANFDISASGGATLGIMGDVTVAGAGTYTLNVPMAGSSRVAFLHDRNGTGTLILGGDNSGFSGGFDVSFISSGQGADRYLTVRADAANSLGTGITRVTRDSALRFTAGALSGSESRVEVYDVGHLHFNGNPASGDRFTVYKGGIVSGTATQLGNLTRGSNLTLQRGAIVGHSSNAGAGTPGTINTPGTAADLLYGIAATYNNAGTTLEMGTGTPWYGISVGALGVNRTLTQGTVTINTTGLDEFILQGLDTVPQGRRALSIGSGASAPVFALDSGSAAIPARIRHFVTLANSASDYAPAFSAWIVSPGTQLSVSQAEALQGKPITIEGRNARLSLSADASVDALTLARGVNELFLGNNGGLTINGGLTRNNRATLNVKATSLGNIGGSQKILIPGHPTGRVSAFLFASESNIPIDLFDYSETDGLVFSSYVTDINAMVAGDRVKSEAATLAADREARDLLFIGDITRTGAATVSLGRLAGGGQATEAALMCQTGSGSITFAPHVDFGTSEGILAGSREGSGILVLTGNVTAQNGLTFAGNAGSFLRGSANNIHGRVIVQRQYLRIDQGNGFGGNVALEVHEGATFEAQISTVAVRDLLGAGTLAISAGNTLSVTNRLYGGGTNGVLTATGAGTLQLSGADTEAVFTLDLENPDVALLDVTNLTLTDSPKVVIEPVAGWAAGAGESVSFTLVSHSGTRSGTFDASVVTPGGMNGSLVYDANAIKLELQTVPVGTVISIQ